MHSLTRTPTISPLKQFGAHRGFTLIEVLIGMSLMGVMLVLLFGSLSVCVRNWDVGEQKIAAVTQKAIIRNFFVNHLQNLLPLQNDFTEVKQLSFQGDKAALQFVSSMPASAGRLGLQLFNISMTGAKSKRGSINVSMEPFFPVSEGDKWNVEDVTILNGVKTMQFSYFGVDPAQPNQSATWYDTWLESQKTPLLVKVSIVLLNGEVWPDIIVPLKVDNASNTGSANPFGIVNGRFTQ